PLLYQDNFEATQGSWELSQRDQAVYREGALILNDNLYGEAAWARPHLRFADFVLDVDARWLGGAVGGTYGLQFRHQDANNFYAFLVRNDGWFTIAQNKAEEWQILLESFSLAISRDGNTNHLHVEATGNNFRFFINDAYLADVQSDGPSSGDIVFFAQKVEGTEFIEVAFDNLVVALYPQR
ncbi:MAG: hypothetical protein L0332_30885, partial [Chloroflexi bacterium]|nr:hypothetical protein [Chloroflexota bacterium]